MQDSLSLRTYNRHPKTHAHDFYQLVLPLQGAINLTVGDFNGKVVPGECIVIRPDEIHAFTALEQARFIVADLSALPKNSAENCQRLFAIDEALQAYLGFIEQQLQQSSDHSIHQHMLELFCLLLSQQQYIQQNRLPDKRIQTVLVFIQDHLAAELPIEQLAKIAFLSPTQFKKLFTSHTGQSPALFITTQRMLKAKALLTNTDLPVQRVAELVGYTDVSAFSRRFSQYFGLPPRLIKA